MSSRRDRLLSRATGGCALLLAISCDSEVELTGIGGAGGDGPAIDGGGEPGTSSASGGTGGGEPMLEASAAIAATCPDVAAEPHYCVTLGDRNSLWAIGPDTGNLCHLGNIDGYIGTTTSIAIAGPHVHGCGGGEGRVWRASILGGPADFLSVDCTAFTGYQGGFLLTLLGSGLVEHHDSFESIAGGTALETFVVDPQFTLMTTQGTTLYTAYFSTDIVQVQDLPSATQFPDIALEGFDDFVNGMSATEDGRLFVLSSYERIITFDVATGLEIQDVTAPPNSQTFSALHCWSH